MFSFLQLLSIRSEIKLIAFKNQLNLLKKRIVQLVVETENYYL